MDSMILNIKEDIKKYYMYKSRKKIINLRPLSLKPFKLVYFSSLILITSLLARIINLQFFNASDLNDKAVAIQVKRTNILKRRRTIVDKNNRLVAFDKPLYKLWAHPRYFNFPGDEKTKIRTIDEVANKLSTVLNIEKRFLLDKFNNSKDGIRLLDDLNEEDANNIRNLHISGLDLEGYSKRFYPQGNLFSNIIGFVNDEREGSSGLELYLSNQIQVRKKNNLLKKGGDGTPLPDSSGPDDFINDDKKIVLTLDSRLQKVAFNVLSKQVKKWKAKKGLAVVMDVNNGEILSLAAVPSFDPNKFWKYDQKVFKGWYLQDLFEPGSTFKPINLALALEEKVIQENGYVKDNGNINVGGWSLSNWNKKGNGYIDYPKVLQVSSNVGMVRIMQNLHPTTYWDWLKKLGLDRELETDLFESTPGQLKSKEIFIRQPIEQAVASFGQGFSISPLKLAQLHAVLANGGYEVFPHVTFNFQLKKNFNKKNKLFSEDVSKILLQWMETVVEEGSGMGAKINGYRIGGKTGTSQKAIDGIYSGKKACSFVAILPIDKPKYLVFVLIDEPSKPYAYGSTVAVPVVKEIIDSLIVLEKIPPSQKNNQLFVNKP